MSSNIVVRFSLLIAGDPLPFAQPFPAPSIALEEEPARFTAHIAASGTATLWQGAPLPSSADFIVISADQDCTLTFTGSPSFTLPLRSVGFPLILPKGAGASVTKIEATNLNTTLAANVNVIIGKAA